MWFKKSSSLQHYPAQIVMFKENKQYKFQEIDNWQDFISQSSHYIKIKAVQFVICTYLT
jgi:hypothetical protein